MRNLIAHARRKQKNCSSHVNDMRCCGGVRLRGYSAPDSRSLWEEEPDMKNDNVGQYARRGWLNLGVAAIAIMVLTLHLVK